MNICNKPMPKAKNGASRGRCTLPFGHKGYCGSETCSHCGVRLSAKNMPPSRLVRGQISGPCRSCNTKYQREKRGGLPKNYQRPGKKHTFPCGCSGVLPERGVPTRFVATRPGTRNAWICRISQILCASSSASIRLGYKPIPRDTAHSVIRKLMDEPNCKCCGEPLRWEFGRYKTPHLHHNHETGEPLGFTHPVCNPRAMEKEISRLKQLLKEK